MKQALLILLMVASVQTVDARWQFHKKKPKPPEPPKVEKHEYLDRIWGAGYHQVYNWDKKQWEYD